MQWCMATERILTSSFTSRAVATTDGEVSITVQDEGRGFDSNAVPDPTSPENRLVELGRGIYLMKTLMDEVRFENGGALVYTRKKPNADSDDECESIFKVFPSSKCAR
jgi:Histidine kinase-like ATPase domain